MSVQHRVLTNTYYDSVFLMGLAGRLAKQAGVARATALMATPKNRELLERFGVAPDALADAGPSDLVLAVAAATPAAAAAALALVDGWLAETAAEDRGESASTLDGALQRLPEANLVVISVPGDYAAYEARRALERGLNVFLFSDNVSVEDELALKREAVERGLIVMGPDCGTALIAGAGIGFANVVRRGGIGVVGPSGTGIQQVTALIDAGGGGVSHAMGAGSRDLSDAVGGLTTVQALDALARDPGTAVIALVAKPPGPRTRARVLELIARSPKPVVSCFLGAEEVRNMGPHHIVERTLAGTARAALRLAGVALGQEEWAGSARPVIPRPPAGRGHVRGLFAGGTFCYEAQDILLAQGVPVRSNAPLRPELRMADPLHADGSALVDLGDDAFTQGRPHPMIDATLRNERILAEARDPSVGALLLDFILGYGAADDPAGDAAPAIRAAHAQRPDLVIVAFVCGTDADPQGRARQVATLEALDVIVSPSSTEAAELVAAMLCLPVYQPAPGEQSVVRSRAREALAQERGRLARLGAIPSGGRDARAPVGQPILSASRADDARLTPPQTGLERLLAGGPAAIALGVRLFSTALEAQGVPVMHVDWTPPAGGDREMLELLSELL